MAINKTVAGTFEVDFRDQYKKRHLKTFDLHKEAVAFEKEVKAQVSKREYVPPTNTLLKDAAVSWYNSAGEGYCRATLIYWKNHIDNYIVPSLGHLKITHVDVQAIEKAAGGWAVAPQTVNKILSTLTCILAMTKRHKMRADNPALEAERAKVSTEDEDAVVEPDEVYNKEELGRLIRATEPGTKERIIVMVLALLGLRIGEFLALCFPAIDFKAGTLHVRQSLADNDAGLEPIFKDPKRKSSRRVIAIPQELIHELKVWKLKCPPSERDLVLPRSDGKPMCRRVVSDILDRVIAKAKIERRLTPHQLTPT
jgi:integrase